MQTAKNSKETTMLKPDIILDNEEQALLDEIERGEWIDAPLSDTEKQAYAQNAAYTKSLNKNIDPSSDLLDR